MVATSADPRQDLDRTSGLVVLDERGDLFTRIRTLDLNVAIWRTRQMPDASESPEPGTLLVLAAYEPPDWARIHGLARRFSTVVAMHPVGHEDAVAALEAGAVGLLDSEMPTEAMRRALRGALRGEPVFSREVLGTWLRGSRGRLRSTVASVDGLTARQREIVALIAHGATDKEIAAALGIRTATAQKHVANVLRRLGVPNRAAAVGLLMKKRTQAPG